MTRARSSVPRLVLGAVSLEQPVFATRDRALEVAGRFREPESLAVTLIKALDAGAEAVYSSPSPTLRAALAELRRAVPVLARLPFTAPADDLFEDSPLAHDGAEAAAGGWNSGAPLERLSSALAGDFATRIGARCEREASGFAARVRRGLVIAAPVTDLALAAGNAKFFERMVRTGRAKFGGTAGFETRNLAQLVTRLHEWGIEPDFVIGSVNPRGFGMRPDPVTVLAALKRPGIPVLATELRAGGTVPLADGAAFAVAEGAWGLVPELVDLDDVAAELRALVAAGQ